MRLSPSAPKIVQVARDEEPNLTPELKKEIDESSSSSIPDNQQANESQEPVEVHEQFIEKLET